MKVDACLGLVCSCPLLFSACSRSNNLLLGRVEATVGGHRVVVTDCYRINVDPPRTLRPTAAGQPVYRFTPCRDADVLISGNELVVNGRSYGHLQRADGVLVDHGIVSIQAAETRVMAPFAQRPPIANDPDTPEPIHEWPLRHGIARGLQAGVQQIIDLFPSIGIHRRSLYLGVFGLGLLENRDVGIGVLPESEEVLIGFSGLGRVARERGGAR